MSGKPGEPKVITDLKQKIVCLLPIGSYFNDEETVQNPAFDDGDTFNICC